MKSILQGNPKLHGSSMGKFRIIIRGYVYALLALPFFIWGLSILLMSSQPVILLLLPLAGVLICLISSLHSMLIHNNLKVNQVS